MKALIVLNLEDCTYEDIEEFGIDEISLDKKGGGCILWTEGFKIMPMPNYIPTPYLFRQMQIADGLQNADGSVPVYSEDYMNGWNDCIDEILGEE